MLNIIFPQEGIEPIISRVSSRTLVPLRHDDLTALTGKKYFFVICVCLRTICAKVMRHDITLQLVINDWMDFDGAKLYVVSCI